MIGRRKKRFYKRRRIVKKKHTSAPADTSTSADSRRNNFITCGSCFEEVEVSKEKEHGCLFMYQHKPDRNEFLKRFVKKDTEDGSQFYFSCDKCFFRVVKGSPGKFLEHYKKHEQDEQYECHDCGKKFTSKNGIYRHVTSIHEEGRLRKYRCEICGQTFFSQPNLSNHLRIHTGERPFMCDICGKSFGGSSSLSKHMMLELGLKKHRCDICSKTFVDITHLRRHLTSHSDERNCICTTCGKSFKRMDILKQHYAVHSGDRPFSCKLCGNSFKLQRTLRQHYKVHKDQNIGNRIPQNRIVQTEAAQTMQPPMQNATENAVASHYNNWQYMQ